MTSCKSCQTPIFWAFTPSGKLCPFDLAPSVAGNYMVSTRHENRDPWQMTRYNNQPNVDRYSSHFATCPNATYHSKKAKA